VGGVYFITTNVDVADGLFNGSTGTLEKIEYYKNTQIPERAWIDFRHSLIGFEKGKTTKKYQMDHNINLKWVGIDRITRNLSKTGRHKGLQVIRTQIPLVPANGMTVHKAQGSTALFIVMTTKKSDHRRRNLTRELLYTGCSRPTTLGGLYIDGVFEPPSLPKSNDPVSLEMARMRSIPFSFTLRFLQDYDDDYEKIYFHNVQSFLAHRLDVLADHCALASNCLAFVEPQLITTDKISTQNYDTIFREDCRTTQRNSEGALVMMKNELDASDFPTIHTDYSSKGHCLFVKWRMSQVNIIMCYKSPNYSKSLFIRKLGDILGTIQGNILVFGDMNIDLKKNEGKKLIDLFYSFNLISKLNIQATSTDGGSHIDCCFSNVNNLEAWFYESYYSYHKPICMVWKK
jgi:hypothetical protein